MEQLIQYRGFQNFRSHVSCQCRLETIPVHSQGSACKPQMRAQPSPLTASSKLPLALRSMFLYAYTPRLLPVGISFDEYPDSNPTTALACFSFGFKVPALATFPNTSPGTT